MYGQCAEFLNSNTLLRTEVIFRFHTFCYNIVRPQCSRIESRDIQRLATYNPFGTVNEIVQFCTYSKRFSMSSRTPTISILKTHSKTTHSFLGNSILGCVCHQAALHLLLLQSKTIEPLVTALCIRTTDASYKARRHISIRI